MYNVLKSTWRAKNYIANYKKFSGASINSRFPGVVDTLVWVFATLLTQIRLVMP